MLIHIFRPFVLASAIVLVCFLTSSTKAAPPLQPKFYLAHQGGGHYDLLVDTNYAFYSHGGSLVAPNGTTYLPDTVTATTENSNLTFAQLMSRIVGTWTLNTKEWIGNRDERYQFTIAPLLESDLVTTTPVITSIANGQIVPPKFNVHWDWPGGVTPSPPGGFGGGISTTPEMPWEFLGGRTFGITAKFAPGEVQKEITVRALSGQGFNSKITSIVSLTPRPSFTIQAGLAYYNYSSPVTVTAVVPEPSSAGLAVSGLIASVVFRRGKR